MYRPRHFAALFIEQALMHKLLPVLDLNYRMLYQIISNRTENRAKIFHMIDPHFIQQVIVVVV